MPNYLSSAVITTYFDYLKAKPAAAPAVSAVTNAQTNAGDRVFYFASHSFVVNYIIVFLGDDGIYRTGHIIAVDATTITIAQPVPSTVASGSTVAGVWNGDAHLVTSAYYGLIDHMFDQINNYDILGDKKIVYSQLRLFRQSTLIGTATRENINVLNFTPSVSSVNYPSLKINCSAQSDGVKFKCNLLAGSYKVKSAVYLGPTGGVLTVNVKNGVSTLATTSVTSYGSTPYVFNILFTLASNSENIYIEFVQTGTLSWFEVANVEVVEHETSSFNLNNKKHACTGDSWGGPLFDRLQTKLSGCTFLNAAEVAKTAVWVDSTFNTNVAPFAPDYVWIFLSHENDFYYGSPNSTIISAIQSVIRKSQAIGAKTIILQPAPPINIPDYGGTVENSRIVVFTGDYLVAQDQDNITFTSISRTYCSENEKSSVTIIGTGFGASQGTGFVKIGTSDLNITSWSATQIVGTIPVKSAGVYDLTIKNNSGNIVAKKDQFSLIKNYNGSLYYRKIKRVAANCYDVDENTQIIITENTISDVVSTAARSDGKDIVVTDIYGNLIPRELAVFSKVSGKMQLWTKDSVCDTYIGGSDLIVQWGGDSVEVANSTAVWTDYQLVAHLEETSGNYKDSSPSALSGVTSGEVGYSHAAKINDGADMPAGTSRINFGDVAMSTKLTLSCWLRIDIADTQVILSKVIDDSSYIQFSYANDILNSWIKNSVAARRVQAVSRGVWNNIVLVYDPTLSGDERQKFYLNGIFVGALVGTIPSSLPDLAGSSLVLGYSIHVPWQPYPLDGAFDEVRVSNVAFKAARLKSQYYNENLSSTNGSLEIGSKYDFDTYTVKFVAGANGSLTGDTTQVINYGEDCSAVTAVPDAQYHFTAWSGDNTSTDNPLTITNITEDMDTTANFAADYTPKETLIPTFTPIAGFSLGISGQLTFNPNSTLGLWLQNPYVLK